MITIDGFHFTSQEVIAILAGHLTEERKAKIDQVARRRCLTTAVVLENIYDPGNVSAVLRTGEALGFYRYCLIDSKPKKFKAANRVSRGADKWLDIQNFVRPEDCISQLRRDGFQVWATALNAEAKDISEVPFDQKIAVVLGNEKDGVTPETLSLCDGNFLLPRKGFSQSYNISVAAAMILYHADRQRPLTAASAAGGGGSNETECLEIKARYYIATLDSAEKILLNRRLIDPEF